MDNLQALLELSKLSASRHDERRKYEWQVSLAFWAFIIGAILKKKELHLECINGLIGISVVMLYAFLWLRGVWVANHNDKTLSNHFRTEALSIMQNTITQITTPPEKIKVKSFIFWFGFLRDWAMQFHLFVTIILVILFYRIS